MADTGANQSGGTDRTNHLDWGNEAAFITTIITTALENGVTVSVSAARNLGISAGEYALEGISKIGSAASVLYQFQEASIDGVTRYDTTKILGGAVAGELATGAVVAAGASTFSAVVVAVGAGVVFDQTFGRLIDTVEQIAALRDDDGGFNGRNMVPRSYGSAIVPRDTSGYGPSDADAVGDGISRGNEYNALDAITHQNYLQNRYSSSSSHNSPRPSDTAIQTSRDIVAGKKVDPSTGQKVYADEIIRQVAAAQTKREQDIAAAQAAAQAAAKAQADAKIKQAQDAAKAQTQAQAQAKIADAAAKAQEYNRNRQDGGGGAIITPTRMIIANTNGSRTAIQNNCGSTLATRNILALEWAWKTGTGVVFGDGTKARRLHRSKRPDARYGGGRIALRMNCVRPVAAIMGGDQGRVAWQGTHATLMATRGGFIGG